MAGATTSTLWLRSDRRQRLPTPALLPNHTPIDIQTANRHSPPPLTRTITSPAWCTDRLRPPWFHRCCLRCDPRCERESPPRRQPQRAQRRSSRLRCLWVQPRCQQRGFRGPPRPSRSPRWGQCDRRMRRRGPRVVTEYHSTPRGFDRSRYPKSRSVGGGRRRSAQVSMWLRTAPIGRSGRRVGR